MRTIILITVIAAVTVSCSSDDKTGVEVKEETPMIYREYIEDGYEEYLKKEREEDKEEIYYRNYREEKSKKLE